MRGLQPDEKRRILEDLARASRAEKRAIMARHGVTKQEVHQWRKALEAGHLGTKRGRKKHEELEREIDRLAQLPEVLRKIREVDPDLASDPRVPRPAAVSKTITDRIVERVDIEELPWDGEIGPHWDENLAADMRSRASRLRRKEAPDDGKNRLLPDDRDYLREIVTNTPEQLCRDRECPCTRLCRVQHIHPRAAGSRGAPGAIGIDHLPPAKHVCQSPRCIINLASCSPIVGGPLHAFFPREPSEEPRPAPTKPIAEWGSVDDCPWHGRCDPRHERPEGSALEVFNAIQSTWHPVRAWCLDPKCPHHRRGVPHIHCRQCGVAWPAHTRYREIDLGSMTRAQDQGAEELCEQCYFLRKQALQGAPPP